MWTETSIGNNSGAIRRERLAMARLKGTHTVTQWEAIRKFFKGCVKCEGATGDDRIQKDHIVPISNGGSDGIENLQPLCCTCNCSKTLDSTDYRKIFIKKYNLPKLGAFLKSIAHL